MSKPQVLIDIENLKSKTDEHTSDLAQMVTKVKSRDARSEGVKTPQWYIDNKMIQGQFLELNILSNVGLIGSALCHVVTSLPYHDTSGVLIQRITVATTGLAYIRRSTNSTTWSTPIKILNQNDYDTLFQYANEGKTKWAEVIGSQYSVTNTWEQMRAQTQWCKDKLASYLTSLGISSVGTEWLSPLVDKVSQISLTGKSAKGTVVSSSNYINFDYFAGGSTGLISLTVSGLTFTPKIIIARVYLSSVIYESIYVKDGVPDALFPDTVRMYQGNNNIYTGSNVLLLKANSNSGYVNGTGFRIPVGYQNASYSWQAYE